MLHYLIACDLDGSLLNNQSEFTEKTKKVLRHLHEQGHKIVIATGRPFGGSIHLYEDLNIPNPMINDNGAAIENPFNTSFPKQRTQIPLAIMHDLFRFTQPFLRSAFFSIDKTVYGYHYEPRLERYFAGINFSDTVIDKPFTELDVEPSGMIFLVDAKKQAALENYIDQSYDNHITYRLWGADRKNAIYEIYLRHVSKDSAIQYLLKYYKYEPHQLMTFGDGINDIEMIRNAGLGVMMKNGVDELKPVAKDITEFTNNEDGIAEYLIKFFNLKLDFE